MSSNTDESFIKSSAKTNTDATPMPKAKMADSIFTNLFRIPEYALQLYQALHPEDQTTTKEQIRIVTLENILLNQPYNDFGMIVKGAVKEDQSPESALNNTPTDKILVLCEAQSTWAMNILVRMLIYWAQTLQEYIVETNQNLYSSRKIQFPVPEFYVIYTGDRKTRPDVISLSDEFGVIHADLKIKMLYDGGKGDIINQYVTFMKVYKEQYKLYGRTQKTILETIRICKDQNILREYLESRRKEVVDIMMTLFKDETIMDAYTKEIRNEGEMKAKKETALTLADMGLSPEKISQAVKVNLATVKQWLDAGMAISR